MAEPTHPTAFSLGAPAAAYVHIPFCARKCLYCDFCSYPDQSADVRSAYSRALLNEIRSVAAWAGGLSGPGARPLSTVFIGGGTPTLLSADQLTAVLDCLRESLGMADDCECTLEANPGTVKPDMLRQCRAAGYNRLSLGLQAAQPRLLDMLGRIHSPDDFDASLELARAAGFRSINADIMFGLPGQTLEDVAETVGYLLARPVDHVSFYALTLEDGTPLKAICDRDPTLLPDEETERAQYHLIRRLLAAAGFEHYEISNAARPGHRCRHNLVYWRALPYYGFGAAAHSYVQGSRRGNTGDLAGYQAAWAAGDDSGVKPFAAASLLETVGEDEARKEMMLLGLRLTEGVSCAEFQARFGLPPGDVFGRELAALVARGLLSADGQRVRLTETGLDLANQVFMEFV